MIGNDIVDLKYNSSNWKRSGFIEKVFTQKEQNLILTSENQHELVWLLWSMKEAAYKAHVQQFCNRFFNPKRLVCELASKGNGKVRIDENVYCTSSIISKEYVYTLAKRDHIQEINTRVYEDERSSYNIQSHILKQRLLKSVSETKGLDVEALEIKKTRIGIPQIYNASKLFQLTFSLTHCGRFSGFAY